jgi:putative FmdB family regulatory protein
MPIYEYKCDECGAIFENFQKITDKDLDICQSCKKSGIKKLISSSGFRLKGSGWYETDFKTGDRKNIAEKSKAETDKKDTAQKSSDVKKDKKKEKKKDISSNKD